MDTTTIEVYERDWRRLSAAKRPGDGMKDVLARVLDEVERDAGPIAEQALGPDIEPGGAASSGLEPRVKGVLSGLPVPGSGGVADARRETLLEMWRLLRDEGAAAKADFLALVDTDAVGYQSPESFWSNCVKGADTFRALPGVEAPREGMHLWRFNPDADSADADAADVPIER